MKNKIYVGLLVALLVLGVHHAAIAQTDSLSNGLIGHWKFDEIDSINFTTSDESGNNNTGAIGTSTRLTQGKFGQALAFDKNIRSQYMETAETFTAPQWSVSAWINPTQPIPNEAPYYALYTFFSVDPGQQLLGVKRDGVYMYGTKITSFDFRNKPGWHHVVVTYDGTNLSAVIDGVTKNSIPYKNVMAKNIKRYVGLNTSPANGNHTFIGSIDEVRLYNRVLTDSEVARLNTAPAAPLVTNFTASTDKNVYSLSDTLNLLSTFTLDPAWVAYLNAIGSNQGELSFELKDPNNLLYIQTTSAFDVAANTITKVYIAPIPQNDLLSGKQLTLTTTISIPSIGIVEKKVTTGISIEAKAVSTTYSVTLSKDGTGTGVVRVINNDAKLIHTYGDSITAGSSASAISKRWVNLLASGLGLSYKNTAVNGSVLEEAGQIDNIYAQNVDASSISAILTGYNNHRYYNTSLTRLDTYKQALPVALAYLSIPNANKIFGTAFTTSGTWTATTTYGQINRSVATTIKDSTAQATLSGSTLYIAGTRTSTKNTGSISITVDGTDYGVYSCAGVESSFTHKRTYAPFMIRIPNLSKGNHTVVLTNKADGYCQIDWAAGNDKISEFPRVYVAGALTMTPGYYITNSIKSNLEANVLYNKVISDTRLMLQADGLNVITSPAETMYTPATMVSPDKVHPNDLGHQTIANSMLNALLSTKPVFNTGTTIKATATPTTGSVFTGWTGACTGTTLTCTFTPTADQTLTATFNKI
jgi:uncharacterized repeat protein (TIGR02543 family)